jgi:hypothetical protein
MSRLESEDVKTREELAVFIRGLRADLARHPEEWESPNLDLYLEALAAVVEDLDGGFMNRGEAVPTQPSWGLVAEILDTAKIYE